VGLFAIKNELIAEVMDHFTKENLRVSCVQIAPMALYNYAYYDIKELQESPNKAVVILDIGAENTTLVVCTRDTVWQRSIRIGGNTFTEAIADAFKKNYATAEKLKRTAPMSKYMRQIYTAMKSVYTDLGSEIQRSLGFYSSSPEGRDKTLSKVIALGGGMKLQGLSKYLTQTLGIQVVKPDSFETLTLSPEVSTAKFHENISDFGIAYGLGVQLLDEAKIHINLLPRKIARAMAWTRKSRMFTVAASVLLLAAVLSLGITYKTLKQYDSREGTRSEIRTMTADIKKVSSDISEQKARLKPLEEEINKQMDAFQYRDAVPLFIETLAKCLPSKEYNEDQAALYEAFGSGDIQGVIAIPRGERKQLFVTRFAMEYAKDVKTADFPKQGSGRTIRRTSTRRGGAAGEGMMEMMEMMEMMRGTPGGGGMMPGGGATPKKEEEQEEGGPGFTILIEGYSPYQNISELLDPPSVRDDQSRWGFITRLENLIALFPDISYELFAKHDIEHFKVETGLVDLDSKDMPAGIGVEKEIERVPKELADARPARGAGRLRGDFVTIEQVLVDPMTNEEISKTNDIITQEEIDSDPELKEKDLGRKKYNRLTGDELFIERDCWFRIRAKFTWKDAPEEEPVAEGAGGMMMGF
jgi:type IV pilus assembly protein PilM